MIPAELLINDRDQSPLQGFHHVVLWACHLLDALTFSGTCNPRWLYTLTNSSPEAIYQA